MLFLYDQFTTYITGSSHLSFDYATSMKKSIRIKYTIMHINKIMLITSIYKNNTGLSFSINDKV
jgi:hypothetical protein